MAESGKLRIHTISFKADTGDATSQTIKFTMALRDNQVAENSIKKAYGETANIQETVVKTTKELTREARSLITQTVSQERRATALVREYTHLASLTGTTAQEQEVLNATYRLGANATNEQIASVAHLVNSQQQLNASSGGVQKSMRSLRGVSQNLGWQVQDVAVQMQMGTNAFVIFSQQGSQLASAFGPAGALVGAFIAVAGALGGVIFKSLDAKTKLKELKEAQAIVNLVFEDGVGKTNELTEEYKKLYEVNKVLAKLTARKAMFAAKDDLKKAGDSVKALTKDYFGLKVSIESSLASLLSGKAGFDASQSKQIEERAKELGITKQQYEELAELAGKGSSKAVAARVKEISSTTIANKKLTDLGYSYSKAGQDATEAAQRIKEAQELFARGLTPEKPKSDTSSESDIEKAFRSEYNSLMAQTESTEQEYSRRKEIINAYAGEIGDINLDAAAAYEKLEEWKTAIHDAALLKQHDLDVAAAAKKNKADEKVLKAIHDAQVKQLTKTNPATAEVDLFKTNNLELQNQREEALMLKHLDKVKEIDLLIEDEKKRNASVTVSIAANATNVQLTNYATVVSGMQSVVGQLSSLAEEGSEDAKALFYVNQALALANIYISTAQGAAAALGDGPLGIPMAEYITGLGMAQAAVVVGTTFAGAYDSGGVIPAGQAGIVAENYDEFVGGTMVYNNSGSGLNVTGSKDTANAMSGGSGGVTIYQSITVSGNGDKALEQAMQTAAKKGAEEGAKKGYNMVKTDFSTGRGIRRDLKKSIGA